MASTDTFEDRTLTAPEDSTGTATATGGGTAAVSPTPGSQPEPETSDPDTDGGAVPNRAVRAPTQPGQEDRGPEGDAADPSDQAAQDRWRDAGQGCGATGRCPEGPQIPGNLAGAAAAAIGGRPWQPPPDLLRLRPEERARFLDQERQRERQELERLVADPDLELDSDVILEAFDRRWARYAAALAGELQQVRREEPDPSMTARWYARLEVLRPAWQEQEVQGQRQMTDAQAARHLDVGARAARGYLSYLRLEQAVQPIWLLEEVIDALGRPVLTGRGLAERPGFEGLGDARMAQRVVDDLRADWHESIRLAAGEAPQPTGSALSRALQQVEPHWVEYEVVGFEGVPRRLSGTEVAEEMGMPDHLARLALDYLRVERRLAAGEALETIGSPLSRALQQVEPHWRASEVEGVEVEGVRVRQQLSAVQLANQLGMRPVMVRAALSYLRSHHQEGPQEGQSRMRMEEGTEALVTPPTDARAPRIPDPGGFTPLVEGDRQLAGLGGFTPLAEGDRQLAGPGGFEATSAREVSPGTLAAVKAAVAAGAGAGLTYLLRLMTLGMCSRGACPALLGPVAPGAAGAVPGHLQG
ncbi:MAG TPA: hypothetical protein VKG45_10800 [Actinomycetes bacterium]|nr:hypothetical protein [Actinomycetes bacterium]